MIICLLWSGFFCGVSLWRSLGELKSSSFCFMKCDLCCHKMVPTFSLFFMLTRFVLLVPSSSLYCVLPRPWIELQLMERYDLCEWFGFSVLLVEFQSWIPILWYLLDFWFFQVSLWEIGCLGFCLLFWWLCWKTPFIPMAVWESISFLVINSVYILIDYGKFCTYFKHP